MGLESTHRYLTDLFPSAESPSDLERFSLNADQLEQFNRDGFLTGIDVLDAAQVQALRDSLEAIAQRPDLQSSLYEVEAEWTERPDEVVFHFLGAWLVDSIFHDLVFNPAATVPCAQALGLKQLRFWHDQVFYKPPRHPGVVPWHQDYSYWTRTSPACHVSMNILLDDSSEENGCIQFVPGSHRWRLMPMASFGGEMDAVLKHLTAKQRAEFSPVSVPLRAGQATIHHSHLIHGSGQNASDSPRRAVVLNYMGPETMCADESAPLLKGAPIFRTGDRIEGDLFPVVLK